MGEMLAVRDAYRAQNPAMLIQKRFYYWLRKLRAQMAAVVVPLLVPLEPAPAAEDILQVQYRC